mmetsp:Transcript_1421/g.3871  ORF Transcript_1421/g.3871 Transcript_1421/m.3871 type:complete len:152 (+) Transcript_1421:83-538(+)
MQLPRRIVTAMSSGLASGSRMSPKASTESSASASSEELEVRRHHSAPDSRVLHQGVRITRCSSVTRRTSSRGRSREPVRRSASAPDSLADAADIRREGSGQAEGTGSATPKSLLRSPESSSSIGKQVRIFEDCNTVAVIGQDGVMRVTCSL